jgi:hypothetical protein
MGQYSMTVPEVFQKLMRALGYGCSSEVARRHVAAEFAVFCRVLCDVTVIAAGRLSQDYVFFIRPHNG